MATNDKITIPYLHELQAIYHRIGIRGIKVSGPRLAEALAFIAAESAGLCSAISLNWGIHVYLGAGNKPADKSIRSINLNASSGNNTPLAFMRDELGFKIPKVSSRDDEGNYISKESLNELALQKMLALNEKNIPGGDPNIRMILEIRELETIKSRYLNANFYPEPGTGSKLFISNYNVAGTVTGRRASRKHSFQYGGNGQNFPKHGELAKQSRRCYIARPGKIFLSVDQMQAEDWPVSALAMNTQALGDLRAGVDRHRRLACDVFGLTWDHYTEQEWKDSKERYLGKKIRHANNYGMRGTTFSDSLAKEGISMPPPVCQILLDKANAADPSIQGVFHKYVRNELDTQRLLRTPFARERYFLGLRAGEASSNHKIFNEAYSYIPQSTVGDNTGFAVYALERGSYATPSAILQEGHDSILQEIDNYAGVVWDYIQRTLSAFNRTVRFSNGVEIQIPVEGELSFDLGSSITLKASSGSKKLQDLSYSDVQAAWQKAQELYDATAA